MTDADTSSSETVLTPWGTAAELRTRRLHPGSRVPRAEVMRNQQERLYGAVVAAVAQRGYEATTVADLIELSGVSRSDFYKHFANKSECLVAAAEALLEPTLEALSPQQQAGGPEQLRALLERLVEMVVSQPAAARVWFVELYAAGAEGAALAERGFDELAQLVVELDGTQPPEERRGTELIRALIGGLRKLIHSRLYRGTAAELEGLVPELWAWVDSVKPPPDPLESARRQRGGASARFEGYTPAERIARAVATVVAEKGYGKMSTDDIAAGAAISLSTFYENFSDKHDAVLAALEMGGAQITASAVPAARRAGDWQASVRALYEAICAYFAAEPEMAQLALAGVYGAGARALARRDRVIDSLTQMLSPGFRENPDAAPITAELAGATAYALMSEQLRRGGPQSLGLTVPLATYITLVGFVGPERACEVANGESRRR